MLAILKEQINSDCTDIHVVLHLKIFGKSIENIQDLLQYYNNNGTLYEDVCILVTITLNVILLRTRNISDKIWREIKNLIFRSINFFRKSWRLGDIVGKYGTARQDTDDNIILSMRIAHWV
jgi:hypothetical protein